MMGSALNGMKEIERGGSTNSEVTLQWFISASAGTIIAMSAAFEVIHKEIDDSGSLYDMSPPRTCRVRRPVRLAVRLVIATFVMSTPAWIPSHASPIAYIGAVCGGSILAILAALFSSSFEKRSGVRLAAQTAEENVLKTSPSSFSSHL